MINDHLYLKDIDPSHQNQHRLLFSSAQGVIEKLATTAPTATTLPKGYIQFAYIDSKYYLYANIQGTIKFAPLITVGAALTVQLTTITHTAPGTPDYAVQNLVQNTGFGFVTADEGNSVLKALANLQTRLAEVEARLEAMGLLVEN